MKVWITGANGQVGSEVVEIFKSLPQIQILATTHAECDISHAAQIEAKMTQFQPDWLINTAAYTAVDRAESEVDVANAINAQGPSDLARACENKGVALLHLSTDFVFDGLKPMPYLETDDPHPLSVYGSSKWGGEQAVKEQCARHILLRVSWVFGRYGKNFVKTMAQLMQSRETLGVVNDQFGGPTPARAIAETILKIILSQKNLWGTYHYCGTPAVSWYELADAVWEHLKNRGDVMCQQLNSITTEQYPTPAKRPPNSRLDCTKILRDFGVEQPRWHDYIQETLF